MKVLAYIPLHYGKDYLGKAIESVYPVVDEILILYTPTPSHGNGTSLPCPDTKEMLLKEVAASDVDDKIIWWNGTYAREGIHRDTAFSYAKQNNFDIVVALDSDEIWNTKYLKELIVEVFERKASKCLIWMRHLWRSFNWICDDPMRQERIYFIGNAKEHLIYADKPMNQVWHFGYARELNQVEYKISIHGHSNEWLMSKDRWFNEKYKPFPPVQDVHPTCKNTWLPKEFNRYELPEIMHTHPYFKLEEIK
jgi:hypothetical protein